MLRSNLCDCADAYILVKGTIAITGAGDDDAAKRANERDKGVIFKNCVPFTKCISRIHSKDIDMLKISILQFQCITWLNIVIIIQKIRKFMAIL